MRSNDVSCLPRPHHWTGSIYSRFSVVTIPSPRWLLGKYIHFLWLGNVCVAIMIKRGICTLCTRCVDPSLAGSTGLLSSRLPKRCRVFPRSLTDYHWSLHYGDIMAGAAHADHWWWWYIRDMSRHSEWWSLPRDAISHHTPTTFLTPAPHSQAKSLPEIFASNSSDHCCLTGLGITKCFQFFDIPNAIALVILALTVKITTVFIS